MGLRVQPGDLIAGKYRIESILGEGGMGVVFAARQELLHERYAIKVISDAPDEVSRERFMREARAAANLRSQHVMRIFDVGEHEGRPYMVMELLVGRDLDALVASEGPRPAPEAVSYVLQACDALGEAHAHGMVHRDVKPANLFLAEQDGRRLIKLLDFGISKVTRQREHGPDLTGTGEILGSPLFMAPEQLASSRDVDARADIWSLGATLFELLSGEVPFDGQTIGEIFTAVVRDPPRPLTNVPPELERVVMRCLEKDPERRYQNIAELARALSPFTGAAFADTRPLESIGNAPTLVAIAPTMVERTSAAPTLTARQQPAPLRLAWWLAGAAVLMLGLAAGGYVWARMQSTQEPTAGEAETDETESERPRKKPPKPRPSLPSDDDSLSPELRDEAESLLVEAEKLFEKEEHNAAIGVADEVVRMIVEAGHTRRSHSSLLAARASTLKGDAHHALARVDLQRTIHSNHYGLGSTAYGEAMAWDATGTLCPMAGSLDLKLTVAESWKRDAYYRSKVVGSYDHVIAQGEAYGGFEPWPEECRARLRSIGEEASRRKAAFHP